MCGIFGLVTTNSLLCKGKNFDKLIKELFILSEERGRESAGLAIASNNKISVFKQPDIPGKMLECPEFKRFLNFSIPEDIDKNVVSLLGHTRLVTNGSQVLQTNNQPIKVNKIVGVHNGIVTNDISLAKKYLNKKRVSNLDTEVLFGMLDSLYDDSKDIRKSVSTAFSEIEGSASVAFFCDDLDAMILATNTGSLYYHHSRDQGFLVFASERNIVNKFFKKCNLLNYFNTGFVKKLNPGNGLLISLNSTETEEFTFKNISDKCKIKPFTRDKAFLYFNKSALTHNLKLCSKCVLPETYPFITFNYDGVCNYCLNYEKQKLLGKVALEKELEKFRSNNGNPDCLVGFSGGRDSSYTLHVLKNEYGMNPIAFTYDWGMITDLARRNQALVCGKLGIEHIIRAANIHEKRRYIQKNINAWLNRPKLGMVPIFMAGDKKFYEYGRRLKKETGIKLTVFGAGQQLEQMEFKVGFCGIDQTLKNNTKLSHFNRFSKIKLALWYIKEFLINPSYINESFFDSILSFYFSFLGHDDFLYLFRYLPWEEKVIDKVIKEEYKWETDESYGKNQWRMGDGHTAFIDYIYHTVAGFSEYDNFRCNQIREGLISRDEAIRLLADDNKPKMEVLADFSQLIGVNLEEIMLKINRIPKLYKP